MRTNPFLRVVTMSDQSDSYLPCTSNQNICSLDGSSSINEYNIIDDDDSIHSSPVDRTVDPTDQTERIVLDDERPSFSWAKPDRVQDKANAENVIYDDEEPSCSWGIPDRSQNNVNWPDPRISIRSGASNQAGAGEQTDIVNPPINRHFDLELEDGEMTQDNFDFVRSRVRYFLNGTGMSITFILHLLSASENGPLIMDISNELYGIFHQIIHRLKSQSPPSSLFRIVIEQSELENPIVVPPTELRDITPQIILDTITAVTQSKR